MNRRDLIDALKGRGFLSLTTAWRIKSVFRKKEIMWISGRSWSFEYLPSKCVYCGLNCRNQALHRYRMTPDEIVDAASAAARAGYRTLVMQSGEDPWFTPKILGGLVKEIKKQAWPSP